MDGCILHIYFLVSSFCLCAQADLHLADHMSIVSGEVQVVRLSRPSAGTEYSPT
jgi:hypothetical protein